MGPRQRTDRALPAEPVFVAEAISFRTWDGGLAAFVEAAFLLLLLRALDGLGSRHRWAVVSSTASLLFFINPMVGMAAFACLAVALWPMRSSLPIVKLAGVSVAVLAGLIVPWTVRNAQMLGSPVPLRSNAGLELAIGMDPGALQARDARVQFGLRWAQVHPRASLQNYRRMRATGGEVAYAESLDRATWRWMIAHPADTLRLMVVHLGQALFPPPWTMDTEAGQWRAFGKSLVARLAAAVGLAGITGAMLRHRPNWIYIALLIGIPALLMMPFQPVTRYVFLLFAPLVFAGADMVEQLRRTITHPRVGAG